MKRAAIIWITVFFLFFFCMFPSEGLCENPLIIKGIELYKQEDYAKAIKILEKARKENPNSSAAAFFLGLSFKQLLDYDLALKHLEDAVSLTPRIKEALVELIEVIYQTYQVGKFEEAQKWISMAEKEDIFPAKIAFLKGLILQKEGKNMAAIESFEKAKTLDKTMSQSADIQIALCYLQEKKPKAAKERLQAAVTFNPQSDLASFARQYQDLVEERIEAEKPLRLTLGIFGQYDTNVVLKPTESALAPDITDEASYTTASNIRLDYVPTLEGPWLFNAQLAVSSTLHDKHSTTHDSITSGIYVAPGYNFGTAALNLATRFNHSRVRSPDYDKYVSTLNVGPLYRRLLKQEHILELFAGYNVKEYYSPPLIPEEDRDSTGLNTYASWVWIFKKGAFFNLKYEFSDENADGVNWVNQAHAFSVNTTIPLYEKLKLQLGGSTFVQDYKNTHTQLLIKRKDKNYSGVVGLNWEFYKNATLIFQFSKSRVDSNIGIYDYDRELYSLGIEYRF